LDRLCRRYIFGNLSFAVVPGDGEAIRFDGFPGPVPSMIRKMARQTQGDAVEAKSD